jgi:hypothetical protein
VNGVRAAHEGLEASEEHWSVAVAIYVERGNVDSKESSNDLMK